MYSDYFFSGKGLGLFISFTFTFLLIISPTQADVNQEALQQTQDLLRDKSKRNEVIKNNNKAKAADKAAEKIGGEPAKQEMYEVAADIMPFLMQQSGGDPAKMQELLMKAQQNPEAFFNSLPSEQRQKIQGIAKRYGNQNKR